MEKKENIARIRKDYKLKQLDTEHITGNPLTQLETWLYEAIKAEINEPTAMVLSTVSSDNKPSSRVLLLKGISPRGLVFYTNYQSRKGRELAANPHGAITLFWPELERQVRVEGIIEKTSAADSDEYFASRPRGSQLGAVTSPQSKVIPNRQFLEEKKQQLESQFKDKEIPRPLHWGGCELIPEYFEFWQGRPDRLHDRLIYVKNGDDWKIERLAP